MVKEIKQNAPQRRFSKLLVALSVTTLITALMTSYALSDGREAPLEAAKVQEIAPPDPKTYARQTALTDFGWGIPEQKCLASLWGKESAWDYTAESPTDDYGIPQRHMRHNTQKQIDAFMKSYTIQIDWGLNYIYTRYGSPCNAWESWQVKRWY
jgi:hypothetical protein